MKFLSNVLLIYLAVPVWLSGIANAQTINIYDEYKAGRRIIKEIITDNNLEKTLTGYAYGGYFIGQSLFLIIKEGDSLFAWTKHDKVTYNIQTSEYSAIYYYFALYDKSHNEKLEFNISTMTAYKKAQKSRKFRKLLPFTKEQQKLIWKLTSHF